MSVHGDVVTSQPDFFAVDQHGSVFVPRSIHPHSVQAFASIDATLAERQLAVLKAYQLAARPITDRQCLALVHPGSSDLNRVRPRITELVDLGFLVESGSAIDGQTGRKVRLCAVRSGAKA